MNPVCHDGAKDGWGRRPQRHRLGMQANQRTQTDFGYRVGKLSVTKMSSPSRRNQGMETEVGYGLRWLHVMVRTLLQSANTSRCTLVLTTKICATHSASLSTCLVQCAVRAMFPLRMFNHIVRSVVWSQRLAHIHVGSLPFVAM